MEVRIELKVRQPSIITAIFAAILAAPLTAGEEEIDRKQVYEFVFYAVLEGLYRDGVSNIDVDVILHKEDDREHTHFIYACPICMPTLNALLTYRSRPRLFYRRKPPTSTFGPGLPRELSNPLRNGTVEERLAVIQTLTQRWIGRRLDLVSRDAEERARWQRAMTRSREQGAEMLELYRKNGQVWMNAPAYETVEECAICQGATQACEVGEAGATQVPGSPSAG